MLEHDIRCEKILTVFATTASDRRLALIRLMNTMSMQKPEIGQPVGTAKDSRQ